MMIWSRNVTGASMWDGAGVMTGVGIPIGAVIASSARTVIGEEWSL